MNSCAPVSASCHRRLRPGRGGGGGGGIATTTSGAAAHLVSNSSSPWVVPAVAAAVGRRRPQTRSRSSRLDIANDASARVRGDVKRVYLYLSDLSQWTAWYPGVKSASRYRGQSNLEEGAKFAINQSFAGQDIWTKYQLASSSEGASNGGKGGTYRLVYAASSDIHTTTDQFVLMPDPNDPAGFTIVRYMSDIKLKNWMMNQALSGIAKQVPELAMSSLSRRLMQADSPLNAIKVPNKKEARGSSQQEASSSPSSPSSSASKRPSSSSEGRTLLQSLGGLFSGLGSNGARKSSSVSASSASGSSHSAHQSNQGGGAESSSSPSRHHDLSLDLDPSGYYRALGLDPRSPNPPDEVKSEFRKLAQTLHPDKAAPMDAETKERQAAEASFKLVQEAYEVLRDVERKQAYDRGLLAEYDAQQLLVEEAREKKEHAATKKGKGAPSSSSARK